MRSRLTRRPTCCASFGMAVSRTTTWPRSPRSGWSRDAARGGDLLHAPGEGRGGHRRGLFRPWREDLQPRYARGAGQDRPRDLDRRRRRDRSQPARAHPRQLGPLRSSASPPSSAPIRARSQPADGCPPGCRRARHLLPRRQPGHDARPPTPRRMERVRQAIVEAAVTVDIVDVGGGFPSFYPGMEPPPLETYFAVIHAGFEALPISYSAELWCEPGRALCAEYASLARPRREAPRRRAVHQRRRLRRAVRRGAHRMALSGPAAARDPNRTCAR